MKNNEVQSLKKKSEIQSERVLARVVATELTQEQLDHVAGGLQAVDYTPTGCPESDCDAP